MRVFTDNCVCYNHRFGREFRLPKEKQLEDYDMFYIGGESLCLTNLIMSFNKNQVSSIHRVEKP